MTNAVTQSDRDESNQNLDESLILDLASLLTQIQAYADVVSIHTKDDKVNKRTVMLRCAR